MRSLLAILAVALTLSGNAIPQEPEAQGVPVEGSATTAIDPNIPTDQLKFLLFPLTRDELLNEAETWRGLVKSNIEKISALEISQRRDPNAQTAEIDAHLRNLREGKNALLERLELVLAAYEEKGGDPEELRRYAAAVSGVNVDVRDVGATWKIVTEWVTSKDGGLRWAAKILLVLAILLGFWILSRIAGRIVRRAITKNIRISHLLKQFINRVVARTVLFVGLLVALSTAGFNVGALLALIGGGAFILGFALQETLGNFAAGMMLLVYRPFDVGDNVEVGGINGKVDSVSLVTTTIRTPDNKVVLVPNKKVWGEVITNASSSPERRVDLIFGIGYGDDIALAKSILERSVSDHALILTEPEPVIRVHELADSSVNFICRPWVKTPDYWDVYWDLTRTVKESFDKEGISIPFPQRDIHLINHSEPLAEGTKSPGSP